jgi:predicted ATPase
VIRRFYVHNFRCLENFELPINGQDAVLLIGRNGAGKTTVALALEILQKIARGTNRIGSLIRPADIARNQQEVPVRFEIEAQIGATTYEYVIAFELPETFKELRVLEERFSCNGTPVYTREHAQVTLARDKAGQKEPAAFRIDWHVAALPIVQEQSQLDPLFIFKQWLSRSLILRPVPALINGASDTETLELHPQGTNFGAWFSGILALAPRAYAQIEKYASQVMPDFQEIRNPIIGKDSRNLEVNFLKDRASLTIPFEELSDGEKCFLICALVLAANHAYGPLFCFWDEPDNYLAIDEVGHFVIALRKAFQKNGGQFLTTSHNSEAIRRFSPENTLLLHRRSHLDPTMVRRVEELQISGDLIGALVRGDIEP